MSSRAEFIDRRNFSVGAFLVEPQHNALRLGKNRLLLEPKHMDVLCVLAQHAGSVLSRPVLADRIWGSRHGSDESLTRAISMLRKTFRQPGVADPYIETIPKRGYRLTQPVIRVDDAAMQPGPFRGSTRPWEPAALLTRGGQRAAADPSKPLLAVLSFDNLSGDPDMTWFAEGVAEELRQVVAQGAELRVLGRGSSFQFRGAERAAANVGAVLGATHVLDGSVRRSGNRVRLAAQLVGCAGETTIWAKRFDRDLVDALDLQEELAATVAAELKIAFTTSV